jgi:hypothetical protein
MNWIESIMIFHAQECSASRAHSLRRLRLGLTFFTFCPLHNSHGKNVAERLVEGARLVAGEHRALNHGHLGAG